MQRSWSNGYPAGQTTGTSVKIPDEECKVPLGEGRFTGGGGIRFDDLGGMPVHVTRGLTIHCDLLLSNNLELNWGKGDKFHMTEHLTTL
jgi:hypothetical protein